MTTAASLRQRAADLRESAGRLKSNARFCRRVGTPFWKAQAATCEATAVRALAQAERLDTQADAIVSERHEVARAFAAFLPFRSHTGAA